MDLKGRRALVTGAGRRLGRAIAFGLARRGVHLAVHHFASERGARATAMEAEVLGVTARVLSADLSVAEEAAALAGRAREALEGLDIVVNSAAILERRPAFEVGPADWDRTMDLNVRAPFFVSMGAAAAFGEAGGAIVNIADVAAFERWREYPVHCVSKAALVALTEMLAKVLAPSVRVNAVAPGPVELPEEGGNEATRHLLDTTPLRRLGRPDDVVNAVLFLLESDFMTGTTVVVDGGRRVR